MTSAKLTAGQCEARSRGSTRLGRLAFISFLLVFCGVLGIGGASLLLVDKMMDKTLAIEEESRNVNFINQLQHKAYTLLLDLHHLQLFDEGKYASHATVLTDEIDRDLTAYLRHEAVSPYPEGAEEVRILTRLRELVRSLRDLTVQMGEPTRPRPGTKASLEQMDQRLALIDAQLQADVTRINELHFEIINRKIDKTRASKSLITTIYLLCSLAGLGLVYLGYCLYSRHVAKPILALVGAVKKFAQGDLGTRVRIDSRTEIGQLYEVFNGMAERLQNHEAQLVAMNNELEDKVRARTRDLEAAHAELVRFEKMAMLGQIATSVNHEVRTPLNTLYLNVQLIKRDLEGRNAELSIERRAQQRSIFNRIAMVEGEVQRVSDMLEEFVRYARLAPPQLADLDLNRVVGYIAEMLQERAEQSRVQLELSLSMTPVMARADENKLIQVLVNLCTNAFHAMPERGSLRLATVDRGEWVEIIVADSGVGIPETDLDKIFLPFFTSKASGLGFGLSIVRRVVEDHGGEITCQSRVGEGTVFTIRLPSLHTPTNGAENGRVTADR